MLRASQEIRLFAYDMMIVTWIFIIIFANITCILEMGRRYAREDTLGSLRLTFVVFILLLLSINHVLTILGLQV